MRGPIIRAAWLAAALAASACGPSREDAARAEAAVAGETATAARDRAVRELRELEAGIASAREAVRAGDTPTASREQSLHVSEIRRGIVVANVALQKARAALSRQDDAAARDALSGAAARLRDVVAGKAEAGPREPSPPGR